MAKKKKAIYDKEAEGEILISSFLPQSRGQPGPGGAACGWEGGFRIQSMEGGYRGDRNQGFKWSSRVKLGSFTDTRSIPEQA